MVHSPSGCEHTATAPRHPTPTCTQRSSSCAEVAAEQVRAGYKGVWNSADCYALNDMVRHGNALWIALLDTSAKLSGAYTGWQL